jgi:NTP pyrophosphatase (non-canonical NTP hydrolase)
LEIKQIFQIQKEFDRTRGWNSYEECQTPKDVLKFMEHFVLVMVEELGEISRIRKQYYRDKRDFTVEEMKHELIDIFVYFMQACMALNMDLEKDYLEKVKYNESRFVRKSRK